MKENYGDNCGVFLNNLVGDCIYGSDPSNGALFYFDDSTTNQWIWSRTQAAWIGNMVFVY